MITPPTQLKERIMLFGGPGSGKSHAYFTIAHLLQAYGHPGRVRVIDTDFGAERVRQLGFPHLTNVEIREAAEWDECVKALAEYRAKSQPYDWIVCDLLCRSWDACQEHYAQEVHRKDFAQFQLQQRAAAEKSGKKAGGAIDQAGWGVIKSMYRGFMDDLVLRPKCNVIVCSSADQLGEKEDLATSSTFGPFGHKPAGEKKSAHPADTVIYMQQRRHGQYWAQTVKDRCRKHLDGPIQFFASEYLVGVAGWVVTQ